ncbi:MAG: Gfo/Idh/MocA family oxidoreductase, partial [Planctomycetota bacterium]
MAKKRSVGIGLVGLGFMGLTHLRAAQDARGGKVVAIATSDPNKARGDFSSVGGNFGDAGGREDMTGISVHPTLDTLLEDDRVDLVDLCLPSYLHAPAAIRCLQAGKAVLVEKPIALDPKDAHKMLLAAKKARRPLMVAQVLRFMPEFSLLSDAVKSKRWGKLLSLHMKRIIAMPEWSDSSWLADPAKSGGMVIDLHIHDTDFIVHLFGKPNAVSSNGLVDKRGVNFIRTTYHGKANGPLLSAEAGWL